MSSAYKNISGAGGAAKAGAAGSGSQQSGATNIKDTIKSKSFARVVEVISEGPIVGLVDDEKSIYFDDTQLKSDDGNVNFEGVDWAMLPGDPDQDWLPGFTNVESEIGVGLQVFKDVGPVVRTSTNDQMDSLKIRIRIPKLLKLNNKGEAKEHSVRYRIGYKKESDPNYTEQEFEVTGITTGPFEKQHYFNVRTPGDLYEGAWNLYVERLTADHDTEEDKADQLFFQSYTEIEEVKLIYPDTAVIGFELPAKTFNGGVPVRSYDIKGRIVRIPQNYNPVTRVYTGIWNGSFSTAWTDNPVWCLLDLLGNTRYGLGLADARVDLATLYTISQYCDELVPDGLGGTQPRYTLNVVLNDQTEAYELINRLCSIFVTMPYYSSGVVSFSQDSPRDKDILVTRASAVEGRFAYAQQSYREQPNIILATWANQELGGKGDVEAVEDQDEIIRRGRPITKAVDLIGVTDRGRAQRLARWQLYSGIFDGEVVTYRAGLDHADCVPGWIVAIRDPVMDGAAYGGRIISFTEYTVTLDREITAESGDKIMIMRPDKSVGEYNITFPFGTPATVFHLNDALQTTNRADLPGLGARPLGVGALGRWSEGQVGSLWGLLRESSIPEVLWRVISKVPVEDTQYDIVAIRHRPEKYALIESGRDIDPDDFSSILTGTVEPVTGLTAVEYVYNTTANLPESSLVIGWEDSPDPRVTSFRVEYQDITAGIWNLAGVTESLSFIIKGLELGTYLIRVTAETLLGRKAVGVELGGVVIDGLTDPPPDVTGLKLSVQGSTGILSWDPVVAPQFDHYEIRFTTDTVTPSWESAATLLADIISSSAQVSVQGGTYLVKAVSIGATYSTNAASVLSNIPILSPPNVLVEILEEDAASTNGAWSGWKEDIEVITAQLKLKHNPEAGKSSALGAAHALGEGGVGRKQFGNFPFLSTGYYLSFDTLYIDLGEPSVSRVTPKLTYTGENQTNVMSEWSSLALVESLGGIIPGDYQVYVEFRFTDQDPLGVIVNTTAGGTNLGNMTGGGGLAAAFDDDTTQIATACARNSGQDNRWIGKTPATPTAIHRVRVYGSTDQGFIDSATPSVTIDLYGKNGASPNDGTDGTKLGSTTFTDTTDESAGRDVFSNDDVTVWDHLFVRIQNDAGGTTQINCAELDVYSPPSDWTDWQLGVVGDYAFRGLQTRTQFVSNNENVTPVLISQHLEIDMPDRTVGDKSFAVGSSGWVDVAFDPAFIFLKGIGIAIRGGATGDYYTLAGLGGTGSEDQDGFAIKLFNASNVQISGTINYVAYGYGKRTV
jgi:predicted phage tail protein